MSDLIPQIARRLSDIYGKADSSEVERRIIAIAGEALAADLDSHEIEHQLQSWDAQLARRSANWSSVDDALADLRGLLLGQQTYRAKFGHTPRRVAGWFFDHYVAVAGLVTILASGFYGLAYEHFYQALDITPEQAGLTVPQILIHSAIGGLALVILMSIAAFVFFMPVVAVRDDLYSKNRKGTLSKLAVNTGLTALGILFLFELAFILKTNMIIPAVIAIGSLVVLLLTNFRIRRRWVIVPYPVLRPMDFKLDSYLILLVAVAIPLGLGFTAILTVNEANKLGKKASNGEAVRDPDIIGMPFLGVRAEPALVSRYSTQKSTPGLPRCMFYLGASNGSVVLYDHRSTGTFQVPSGEIAIELRRNMSSCEAPINSRVPSVWRHGHDLIACGRGKWKSDLKPQFSFEWTMEGREITDKFDRVSPLLDDTSLSAGSVIHCRVTATTPLGSDVAVSPGIVVRHDTGIALHTAERAGR